MGGEGGIKSKEGGGVTFLKLYVMGKNRQKDKKFLITSLKYFIKNSLSVKSLYKISR